MKQKYKLNLISESIVATQISPEIEDKLHQVALFDRRFRKKRNRGFTPKTLKLLKQLLIELKSSKLALMPGWRVEDSQDLVCFHNPEIFEEFKKFERSQLI